jgi:hypothetical protein
MFDTMNAGHTPERPVWLTRMDAWDTARALARTAPDWTREDAKRYALAVWETDGHGAGIGRAIGYAFGGGVKCPDCATAATLDTGLTIAQDAALAGIDAAYEHASADTDGAEVDAIPTCDACLTMLDAYSLTTDGVREETAQYAALAAWIDSRRYRPAPERVLVRETSGRVNAIRRDALLRHGVTARYLDVAAMLATIAARRRERADGTRP